MHNNPGFIKWFVAAVKSGKRPEEILAKPVLFLDFCMSNVYNYLSNESKAVLQSMLCLPGSFTLAELGFLNKTEYLRLQPTLHQLLTTNMVTMTTVPTSTTFLSQYDLSDLARAYLGKHHPVSAEDSRSFTRRRQQVIAASEQIRKEQRNDPYSPRTVSPYVHQKMP